MEEGPPHYALVMIQKCTYACFYHCTSIIIRVNWILIDANFLIASVYLNDLVFWLQLIGKRFINNQFGLSHACCIFITFPIAKHIITYCDHYWNSHDVTSEPKVRFKVLSNTRSGLFSQTERLIDINQFV